ncbi:MAG: hypothetical protein Q8Q60_01385 [Candidatus Chromulinivorax sp.]|nr:hypothetical protein [Candidatus Chromulinivorax sp.]
MKKTICLMFVLSLCFPVYSSHNKKIKTGTFDHLKRRHPRKHGLQPHGDKLEQDDFGYMPNKKAYKN